MCGIAGIFNLKECRLNDLISHINVMNKLVAHRGPDGTGSWCHKNQFVGLTHRRLSIIDIDNGAQPMSDKFGNVITYNGEIYNYLELREQLSDYPFQTNSDTEVILAAYHQWGESCVDHLRGMFAFALWDETQRKLFCARDKFGIKPFYFSVVGNQFYFASEAKALLPFLPDIRTDYQVLKEYLVFQFCLGERTLFDGISSLLPAHTLVVQNGKIRIKKYWEVYYHLDFNHTEKYFKERLLSLLEDSVRFHIRSDVPIGAYVSGGIDSSAIAALASKSHSKAFLGFTGKFGDGSEYDESPFAREVAHENGFELHETDISSDDFIKTIETVIFHLDYPVAGPGSFPQYHVAKLASKSRKVVLGGQGGDEIFGGYTRYLIAYFEQCIKAAINGTMHHGNFVVTYESIIPNLVALRNYKPLLQQFWSEGMFDDLDKRYYRLINRAPSLEKEINWAILGNNSPFTAFQKIFHGENVSKESYFDSMTHFDFKTLLPALLHVEDRMSMAHGVESRVPYLDSPLVEFVATIPADVKFKAGELKKILIQSVQHLLPPSVANRKDKMGFPVPLTHWLQGEIRDFVLDIFTSKETRERPYFHSDAIVKAFEQETKFGRKIWGLLSLELWHRQFHDRAAYYRDLVKSNQPKEMISVLANA